MSSPTNGSTQNPTTDAETSTETDDAPTGRSCETIVTELGKPLSRKHVSTRRTQAGITLSYLEGWHVIAEANRIFGHLNWNRVTELTDLGCAEQLPSSKQDDLLLWHVRFMAKVTITVRVEDSQVMRQGVGYGSGIARDLGDAYENAIKEAETDATKRALMTFGWLFGLALYDKKQENVSDETKQKVANAEAAVTAFKKAADNAKTLARLDFLMATFNERWPGAQASAQAIYTSNKARIEAG